MADPKDEDSTPGIKREQDRETQLTERWKVWANLTQCAERASRNVGGYDLGEEAREEN